MKALERYTRDFIGALVDNTALVSDAERVGEVYLTRIFETLNIPQNYYTPIRRIVFESEPPIAVLLSRGAGGRPSVVSVMREASDADFAAPLTVAPHAGTLAQDNTERIKKLEAWRLQFDGLNVIQVLVDYEQRLARLESLIQDLG